MKKLGLIIAWICVVESGHAQEILAKHSFEAEGVEEVLVQGKFCDVSITEADKVRFEGVIEGKGKSGDFQISSILSGRTLFIEVTRNIDSPWSKLSKAELTLSVPDGTSVRVENSSGDVVVRDLRSPIFNISTSSGDIKLTGLNGQVLLSSTSGSQYLYGIIGNIDSETTSGDQELSQIDGDVNTNATSGDIEFSRVDGNVRCETTSGDISIRDFVGALMLQSTSGDISGGQVALTNQSLLKASSGDIQIRFKDNLEKYYFDIQSTSGFLRIGEMHGEKNLKSTSHGVEVLGLTTSGDQYYTN